MSIKRTECRENGLALICNLYQIVNYSYQSSMKLIHFVHTSLGVKIVNISPFGKKAEFAQFTAAFWYLLTLWGKHCTSVLLMGLF